MSKTKTVRRPSRNGKAYKMLSWARAHSVTSALLPDVDGVQVLIPYSDRTGESGFVECECRTWNDLRDALGY